MRFTIDNNLLEKAHSTIGKRQNLYWIVGSSGSGKTTICKAISEQFNILIYDMDAHIYGDYHGRFSPTRHPINTEWTSAPNQLAWSLNLSWEEFNNFNQAALPEYVDLLAEDIKATDPNKPILIDGGICNPALAAQVLPAKQLVCIANPNQSSIDIWEGTTERLAMKNYFTQFPSPEDSWQKFLDFDGRISQTILQECQDASIPIYARGENETVVNVTAKVTEKLGLRPS